jgi:hypothetical protein
VTATYGRPKAFKVDMGNAGDNFKLISNTGISLKQRRLAVKTKL